MCSPPVLPMACFLFLLRQLQLPFPISFTLVAHGSARSNQAECQAAFTSSTSSGCSESCCARRACRYTASVSAHMLLEASFELNDSQPSTSQAYQLKSRCRGCQHAYGKKVSQQRPAPQQRIVMMPLVLLVECLPRFRQRTLRVRVNGVQMWGLKVFDESNEPRLLGREVCVLHHCLWQAAMKLRIHKGTLLFPHDPLRQGMQATATDPPPLTVSSQKTFHVTGSLVVGTA